MFALKRRAIGVSVALVAAASLTASLLLSTALAQNPPDPSITSITVSDITMTTATVTVNLADDDADGTTVYLKFGSATLRPTTNPRAPAYNVYGTDPHHPFLLVDENAPPLQATSDNGAATFDLPDSAIPAADRLDTIQDLWSSYEVKVEASLAEDFSSVVVTDTFTTLPPKARGGWFDAEKTAMDILTWLSNKSGIPHVVYYRWRAEAATTWNTGSFTVPWGNPQTNTGQVMTGLVSHSPYVMELSLDPTFLSADETVTDTGWTREPDVVRMGIRKVTETEATVTAVMDHPNGKDYGLGCQYNPNAHGNWSYIRDEHPMVGFVGETLLQSLIEGSQYDYQCRLSYDHGQFETYFTSTMLSGKSLRTLDTDTALTEISATLSGTSATITVDLANTDGTNNDVYLRHREYPTEEWSAESTRDTTTATAQWTTTLTNDKVHEFEASLDQSFPETETLTLFLTVGNPPYNTVANSSGNTHTTRRLRRRLRRLRRRPRRPMRRTTLPSTTIRTTKTRTTMAVARSRRATAAVAVVAAVSAAARRPATRRPNSGTAQSDMRTVPENSEEGVIVGKPILAWDPENDVLAFSLRGDDAEPFTIDEETGQILVVKDAVLDYEAQDVHVVTLVVTDPGGEETTTELEIHLTDVKLPGKADIFDVANNHNEMLEREEVEAAGAAYGLGLISKLEVLFIVKYYYDTMLPDVDFENLPSMTDKYDLNEDSIIDRDEVLTAMQDFLEGRLSRSDLQEIMKVYYTTVEEQAQEAEPAQT